MINPTKKINRKYSRGLPPLPNLVINPKTFELDKPKELDAKKLSNSILFLSKNKNLRLEYGHNLYQYVSKKFSIRNYFDRLEEIYQSLD